MTQIKSRDRVRDLAEVYTNEREVNAMLDLIPIRNPDDILTYTYLEPACGNGNFLIEILRRKLKRVHEKFKNKNLSSYELNIAKVLSTIYGIDICNENVEESRARLFTEVKAFFDTHKGSYLYSHGFLSLVDYILKANIVVGDTINRPADIKISQFKFSRSDVHQLIFKFSDLSQQIPLPIEILPEKNFLLIGIEHENSTGVIHAGIQGHFNFI
jgi:hypothetical protein